jgi:quercetin dioxygenase-like cupin family protein
MRILPNGARPARLASADYFTGTVVQEPVLEATPPARARLLRVTFLPRARTNWHTHPLGQCLHILSGVGIVQTRGGQPAAVRAGDTVWFEPEEEHWHGATATNAMVHLALQEADADGQTVRWLEPVSEADYASAQCAA